MKTLLALCMVVGVGMLTGCGRAYNGGKYRGDWKDGKPNGQGTWTCAGCEKYVGEWKDGNPHGQGTLTKPDGTTQSGLWKDGEYLGPATNDPTATGVDKKP